MKNIRLKAKINNSIIGKKFIKLFIVGMIMMLFSCIENPKKIIKDELKHSSLTDNNSNQNGSTIKYEKFAITKFNQKDFSWSFLEEHNEPGEIRIIGSENKLILNNSKIGKELFIISKIQKNEGGFIATTVKNNVIIFAIEYGRIAVGREGSDIFIMFFFKDEDRVKINKELNRMIQ